MKHFFITLYLLGISLFSSAQQEEKAALLITHYGSSDPQTRALTLDVVTREAQEAFPQFTVREAYISPIVRKRLAKEGVYPSFGRSKAVNPASLLPGVPGVLSSGRTGKPLLSR